jgi:hypothetical protein
MNSSLINSAPIGDFVEVSALVRGFEIKFHTLISQRKPIKYDMYPIEYIPEEFKGRLSQLGYQDLILEKDRWQHFLVPSSSLGERHHQHFDGTKKSKQ